MALNLSALKGGGSPTSQDAPTLNLSAFGQKPQTTTPSDAPMKAVGLDFTSFGNKGSTPGLSPVQFQAPAQVRVPFGTNKDTVPAAQGLTAMAEDTVSRLLEVIPKTVIQFAQNVKPMYDAAHEFSAKPLLAGSDGEKPLSLPFNAQRLGFADGLESTGKATWDTFLGLESSNTSGNMGIAVKNAAIATISHVVPDTLNAIIAGDEITGAAKQALKLTYFDPELDSALQQMQLQRGFSYGEFKGNFTRIGTELAQAGDSQGLNDLARAASTIGQRMASGGSGIGFQISKLGQAVQNVARTLTTPIEDFGMEAGQRPLGTPQGQLPGFRPAGGGKPIPNVGLGIQPEESVGGAPEITPPEKGSFAIPKTSDEAAHNFYEQKVKPAMDSGQAIVIGADDIKDLHGGDYNPANHPIYSKAANDLFTKSVKESTNPVVKIIVGGTGSGKSDFAVPDISKNFSGVIYDSTGWNYEGLKKQIEIAKAAGKTVEIYGLVPPDLAKTKAYTLLREQAGGHPVSNESFNRTHAGAVQTLLQAAKDGADVRLGDLTDPQNFKWNPVNVADLQGKAYNEKEIQQKVNHVNTTNAKEIAGGNSILRGGNEGSLRISEKNGPTNAGNAEETRRTGTKKYSTIHAKGKIKIVEGTPVKIIDGVETFLHKGDGGWIVSEASTGRFLAESRSKEGAIAKAHFEINNVGKKKFLELLKQHKLGKGKEDPIQQIKNIYSSHPEGQNALRAAWEQMDIAEAGSRYSIPASNDTSVTGTGGERTFGGIPSTFPQWIPEELRSRKLFDKVMGGLSDISNIKYPEARFVRQRALYDAVLDYVDKELGISTKDIRNGIMGTNGSTNEINPSEVISGSTEGSEAGGRQGIAKSSTPATAQKEVELPAPPPRPPKPPSLTDLGLKEPSPFVRKRESTLLNERMRTLARGARMAASGTKEEIAKAQSELVDIINKSDLDLNDKGKFLATVKNIQTLDQFNKAMPEIEERIAKLDEASTKRSLLAEIKGELGEKLYTGKGDARIGKYSPSIIRKLQSFKEELSFKDPASLKMKQLEITQNWMAEHPDEAMPNSVIESLDELQRTHLKLLTNAELEEQLQSIQNLKTQGKTFKELKLRQIARDRGETIRQFKDDITGGKGVADRGPVIESQKQKGLIARWAEQAKEFLYTRQLISDNIFDILDEKAGTKLYAGRIHDKFINLNSTARDARISGTSEALHKIQPLLEKVKKDLMKTVDLGDGIKLTRNEMIDVYMRSHDPAQLESMIEGNKIPLSKIKEIKGSLTPDEIAVAEAALAHWDQNYDSMNRVFREKHFFDMPRNVGYGYSPMPKDMQFVADEDVNLVKQQMDYAKASVPKGMTKLRSGSLAPVRLGFVQNFVDGVTRAEHYKAYELPIQEMNAILNGIKEAVTQEHGIDYYKLIRDYVKKSANQGKYDTSYLSKALLKLRSSASSGILGLNLVTSVKHMLASIGGALTELNEKEFGIGIFNYFKNKKIWDAFWDKVPQFAERSSSATRELQEVTTTKGPLNTALGKSSLKEKFMTPLRVGDKLAVRSEATAVYLREVKNGASKEQAIQSAVSKLRRTQTGGSPEDLSSLMTGGSMEKMLTMFATEQNKYLNLMYGYSRAYAKGRIPFSKFARALFYTWIFNGLAMEEARKGGKATPSDLAEALFLGPFENVLVLGGIIESVRTGYQYEASPVFGMLNSMKTYLGDIKNGKAIQGLEGLGETVGTAAGAPVAPVKRIGTGAYNLLTGKTNDWRQLIWSASALGETKTAPKASGTGLGVLPKLPQLPRLPALPKIGR